MLTPEEDAVVKAKVEGLREWIKEKSRQILPPAQAPCGDTWPAAFFATDDLRKAVDENCTCGGMGPNDPGVCVACKIWHAVVTQ